MRKLLCLVMAVLVTGCTVRVGNTPRSSARTIGPGPNDPTVHYVVGGSLLAFGLGLALYDSQVDTDDNQDDYIDGDGLLGAVGILIALIGASTIIRAAIVSKQQPPPPQALPPQGYPPPGYPPPQPYPQPYPPPTTAPQPYPPPTTQPAPYPPPTTAPQPYPPPPTQPAPQPYPPAPTPAPAAPPPPPPPPSAP